MDEVRRDELREERGHDVGEEDDAFGKRADEVLRGGEDDHVEDIVNQACNRQKCAFLNHEKPQAYRRARRLQ